MDDLRAATRAALQAAFEDDDAGSSAAWSDLMANDCRIAVADPVGALRGAEASYRSFLAPLREALSSGVRRDIIVIGGRSRVGPGTWVATLGHYVGLFTRPLFGIAPTRRLAALRCGEFYRLEEGRVVEAYILPDLVDLLRQAGRMPLPDELGAQIMFPAPATLDGVCPVHPERSEAAAALVEAMLSDLHAYDPDTFASANQTGRGGYWADRMFWYGPGGIGSTLTYEGFDRHHRVAFLTAFPDRKGGNHFARFGDGDYVASGGWPSMTMTHAGPYLGVAPTNRPLTCRVMDFWRVADDRIAENWVLIDMVHLFAQMGVDLLAGAGEGAAA